MNLQLRKLKEDDRDELARLANNRNIWNLLRDHMPHPFNIEDADRFIAMKKDQLEDYVFCIDYEGKLSGMIGLHPQTDIYRCSLELGYWIGEPYWGKGLASQAVANVLEFGFSLDSVNRIFAGVLEHNKASRRVLEKNGFVFEGIARKAVWKNEELRDEWRYGILKDEFKIKRSS